MKVLVLRAAIAAVVLALGIAIGAGPLQEDQDARARALAAQQAEAADLEQQVAALSRSADFSAAYEQGTTKRLVGGVLKGRTVALVALPGADPVTVAAFRELIATAGGTITADVPLPAPLVDPGQRQLVEALTSQMAVQEKVSVPARSTGYERFGVLLSRAIGIPPAARSREAPYDETALGIVSGFQTAELVGSAATVSRRAALTLVVTGPEHDARNGRSGILAALVRGYAVRARVVVVGPTGSEGPDGVVGVLRGLAKPTGLLSTVDSAEHAGARVAAILALAARIRGTVGSYGGDSARDGAVPAP